ncbi:unnamed protein product [Cylicostephanus goldi]|uniref:Uncharacterized protein n=1 Tax=Cylicostephanus goldi TaxID=71465 RepID=A0A3P7MDV5_CYLGO|nr:unnamed protein product [Cylicostephanus goldi]
MKLYTPGNGLFETHVTWEDIEKDMQRELHTSASFGPKKSARNIADGIILTQLLMAKLTAEMGIGSDFNTVFEELQKTLHNGEVSVYNHLINYGHENFPIPKVKFFATIIFHFNDCVRQIYFMKKFSESNPVKGYIIMEYLENFKTMKIYNNVTVKAVKEVLAAIAIMEAMSLKFTPEEKEELTRSFEQFHKVLFKEDVGPLKCLAELTLHSYT